MINYLAVLSTNYSTQGWTLNGNEYNGLTWLDTTPKPTEAELDAQWPAVEYQTQYNAVETTRRTQYEAQSDGLFFEWQRGTNTQAAWETAVDAIKAANPYPPAPTKKK